MFSNLPKFFFPSSTFLIIKLLFYIFAAYSNPLHRQKSFHLLFKKLSVTSNIYNISCSSRLGGRSIFVLFTQTLPDKPGI